MYVYYRGWQIDGMVLMETEMQHHGQMGQNGQVN